MNFCTLELEQDILRAIDDLGFEHLTPIQEKVIPELLGGETDIVGLAQTGTGKTAAFGLPMIQFIDYAPDIFGLIFCRTRKETGRVLKSLKGAKLDGRTIETRLADCKEVPGKKKKKKSRFPHNRRCSLFP